MGDLVDPQILKACLFYGLGQVLAFFQIHSQLIWKWWDGKPITAVLVFGIPAGICFWFAVKTAFAAMAALPSRAPGVAAADRRSMITDIGANTVASIQSR